MKPKHTQDLTADEKAYLRRFLKEHYDFYHKVAQHGSTPGNTKLFALVESIWLKLQ
jgi:ubiquinone biosynthesis protein Coq4